MRTRTGKIARLPRDLRHQLNIRLERAEPGQQLLDWLHALPEVRQLLQQEFNGGLITKQNLSHWRQNGFQDWLAREDLRAAVENAAEFTEDMEVGEEIALVDNVATLLAARYAALVARWDGAPHPVMEAKAGALNQLCRNIVRLQKSMHWASRENHEAEQREAEEQARQAEADKKAILQPIFDEIAARPMATIFGGGEFGKKLARFILAIRDNRFDSPDAHPHFPPKVKESTEAPPPPTSEAVQPSPTSAELGVRSAE